MTTIETTRQNIIGIEEFQPLASCTLSLLDRAARQAYAFEAAEVGPEYLLMAALVSDDEESAEALTQLGMDRQVLRAQVRAIFQAPHEMNRAEMTPMSLSPEAHECVKWAIEQASAHYQREILPVHILLASLRCSRAQPLLALLLSGVGTILPAYVSEEDEMGYTRAIDQLLRARIRMQRIVPVSAKKPPCLLTSLERPTLTFADILGFQRTKQELREVVDFLRKPRLRQSNRLVSAYGILLIGAQGNNRTLLVRALAGEAVVPLVCLAMPALVEMVSVSEEHEELGELGVDVNDEAYQQVKRQRMVQRGREVLSSVFEQARQAAPSILLIDDLDALAQVGREVCLHWQKQLMVELDACDSHPAMVVVATTHRPDYLDSALVLPGRFEHRVVLDGTVIKPFTRGQMLCPACQHEVPPRWKYCTYCGAALARTCAHCGNRLPDMLGLRFCPECGAVIEA